MDCNELYSFLHNTTNKTEIENYLNQCYDAEYIGYVYFNYIILGNKQYITWPLIILTILLCFYFLSTTIDEYLSKILGRMSVKLKISQNLAGLTLLALGNQAVDIMVALVTGEEENGGLVSSLSALLGGDSIVIGFVLPTVIFLGNGFTIKGRNLIRDTLTYLCSLLFIFCLGAFRKNLNLVFGFIIFFLYFIYVGICILMEKIEKKREREKTLLEDDDLLTSDNNTFSVQIFPDDDEENENKLDDGSELIKVSDDNKNKDNNKIKEEHNNNKKENEQDDLANDKNNDSGIIGEKIPFNINNFLNDQYYIEKTAQSEELKRKRSNSILTAKNRQAFNKLNYAFAKYYLNSEEAKWEDLSTFKKIIRIVIETPINFIRDITIPPFEKEKWKKELFSAMPITIPLALSVFFYNFSFKFYTTFPYFIYLIVYFVLAIGLGIFLYYRTYTGSLPDCEWVLLIISSIMTMLWIYVITNILIQMVMDAQLLLPFEVSPSFLIMTILAMGNALPDFLVDCTLAKTGFAEMALSGTIGAPVFSLLLGFGLTLIKNFIVPKEEKDESSKKQNNFDLLNFEKQNKRNLLLLCAMTGVFFNLIHYMIVFSLAHFKVKRYASYTGYFVFICYLTSLILFSFVINIGK